MLSAASRPNASTMMTVFARSTTAMVWRISSSGLTSTNHFVGNKNGSNSAKKTNSTRRRMASLKLSLATAQIRRHPAATSERSLGTPSTSAVHAPTREWQRVVASPDLFWRWGKRAVAVHVWQIPPAGMRLAFFDDAQEQFFQRRGRMAEEFQ